MSQSPMARGYVANGTDDTYQVSGMVTFAYFNGTTSTREAVQTSATAAVPPHQTVLAAETRLPFNVAPGQRCDFETGTALRRQNP
jgi:hypothetical protein